MDFFLSTTFSEDKEAGLPRYSWVLVGEKTGKKGKGQGDKEPKNIPGKVK